MKNFNRCSLTCVNTHTRLYLDFGFRWFIWFTPLLISLGTFTTQSTVWCVWMCTPCMQTWLLWASMMVSGISNMPNILGVFSMLHSVFISDTFTFLNPKLTSSLDNCLVIKSKLKCWFSLQQIMCEEFETFLRGGIKLFLEKSIVCWHCKMWRVKLLKLVLMLRR